MGKPYGARAIIDAWKVVLDAWKMLGSTRLPRKCRDVGMVGRLGQCHAHETGNGGS